MDNTVVLGTQWGDEGKGKIIDFMAKWADWVVRFQGGTNAGHTVVVNGKEYIFHLIPSGIIHPEKRCLIANGVVVDPPELVEELERLAQEGIEVEGRLCVSRSAHVIMPYHKKLDALNEKLKGDRKIGTTMRGIGPTYSDKMARLGIRMEEFDSPERLKEKLAEVLKLKNLIIKEFFGEEGYSLDELYSQALDWGEKLRPFLCNSIELLRGIIKRGEKILFEGAQGALLDIDHGTYPFVTSSSTTVGGVSTGTGLSPKVFNRIIGVSKAYTTRVGGGPFPTELEDELGQCLRDRGKEYGATTGRPRRCGWLDLVTLKYVAWIDGLTGLAITKLDVLDTLPEIKVCVAYDVRGEKREDMPLDIEAFSHARPIFKAFPGWKRPVKGAKSWEKLPKEAQGYLEFIEENLEIPISIISTGPEREETILRGL